MESEYAESFKDMVGGLMKNVLFFGYRLVT